MAWRTEKPVALVGNEQYVAVVEVCDDGSNGYRRDGTPIESFRARFCTSEQPCGIGATPRDAILAFRDALSRIIDDMVEYAAAMPELQIIAEKIIGGADRENVS